MLMPITQGGHGGGSRNLFQIIQDLSLDTNCLFCLDAASSDSYSGSGDLFSDLTANGHDFDRGSTTGSTINDPTFNGTAGGLSSSEYFSFDGADWFQISGDNKTPTNFLHQDSAAFTYFLVFEEASNDSAKLFSTHNDALGSGQIGLQLTTDSSRTLHIQVLRGVGSSYAINAPRTSGSYTAAGSPVSVGISYDEAVGSGGAFWWSDGSYVQLDDSDTFTSTYNSPSDGVSAGPAIIGADNGGYGPWPSGNKFFCAAMFNAALTKTNMDDIWSALNRERGYI